jgi:hypothetical protein
MRTFVLIAIVLASLVGSAHAQSSDSSDRKTWYEGYSTPKPATLRQAIQADREFLGASNPYWKEVVSPGLKEICAAMHTVRLTCDYNTRVTLSLFLSVNKKGLFPAAGGTNPYYTEHEREIHKTVLKVEWPDDGFIGHPPQNQMLAAAVRKNTHLFKDGDLTADAVKRWK